MSEALTRDHNQEDAALYLRIWSLKDTAVQAEARAWFFESFAATTLDEFNERYPRGSRERHLFAEFLGFYEGAGVLVSRGLLHEDVSFDAPFALEVVWPKVSAIIEEMQEKLDPAAWEKRRLAGKAVRRVAEHEVAREARGRSGRAGPTGVGTST